MGQMQDKPCKHPCCPDTGPCRKAKQPKRRRPIRKVSKKEQARIRKYRSHKQATFTGDDICAVALLENKTEKVIRLFKECQYTATQFHHPAGRIGDHLYDEGIKLCGVCHDIIERNPNLAKELGLSKSRLHAIK